MDTKINPWLAALIIAVFIGLIGAYSYFSMAGTGKGAVALHSDSQGNQWIAFTEDLFKLSADGTAAQQFPASAFNVYSFIGDFAVFNNDDLLIYQKADLNIWQTLLLNTDTGAAPTQNGLLRCVMLGPQPQCQPFSDYQIASSFKLAIDPVTEHVFIADTVKHKVVVLDAQGKLIQTIKQFQYPNQLWIDQQTLYVTDTNNHRISAFAIQSGKLDAKRIDYDIIPDNAPSVTHTFPTAWVKFGDYWLHILTNHALAKGAVYAIADLNTPNTQIRLPLPENADPIVMSVLGQYLVVSDFKSNRLYRFDQTLQPVSDLSGPLLQDYVTQLTAQQRRFAPYKYIIIALGISLFGGLLGFMLYKEKTTPKQPETSVSEQGDSFRLSTDQGVEWVTLNKARIILITMLVGLPIIFIPTLIRATSHQEALPLMIYVITAAGASMLLLFSFVGLKWFEKRIGRYGDYVVIRNFSNQLVAGRGSHLTYNERQIQIDGMRSFNDPKGTMYCKQQMQQLIQPLLAQGIYTSTRMMFKQQNPADKRKLWLLLAVYVVMFGAFYYLTY